MGRRREPISAFDEVLGSTIHTRWLVQGRAREVVMRILWMVWGASACVLPNPNYPPALPLEAEFTDCEVDEDCTLVELGCCDACNGGFKVSVRTDRRQEVEREFAETCPGDFACTLLACPPDEAVCDENNTCAIETGSF